MQIKFFQKQKVFKKEDYSIYPRKFWKIILCVSFSMVILSFVFGALMFLKVNKDFELSPEELSAGVEVIKVERLNQILEYFSSKEQKSNEILVYPAPVVDPSL